MAVLSMCGGPAWLARRWLLGGFLLLGGVSAFAQLSSVREYQVKAVFLFNFAQFVDWPADAFPASDSPLVLGVLGNDPFGAVLDEAVRDEKAGAHPLEVRRYRRLEDADGCHILFIGRSEATNLESIVLALQNRNVLTVSDSENAARRGVMIRFINDNNRVRLRINLDSTRRAGLTISSKLLRAAEIVGDKP